VWVSQVRIVKSVGYNGFGMWMQNSGGETSWKMATWKTEGDGKMTLRETGQIHCECRRWIKVAQNCVQ